jgi:hypothetical protein
MNRAGVVLNRCLDMVVLAFAQSAIAQNLLIEAGRFFRLAGLTDSVQAKRAPRVPQSFTAISFRLRAVGAWPTLTGALVVGQAILLGVYWMLGGTACGSNGTR